MSPQAPAARIDPGRAAFPALLGLLAALAIVLRFAALTEVPASLWVDETWFEYRAFDLRHGGDPWPTVDRVFASGNSPFQLYATALVQALGAPAVYASRWVSAICGALAVAACGWLAWELTGPAHAARRRVAVLTAMGLMAPLFTALLFSRDGTQNSSCLLMTAVFLAGLHRALEGGRAGWAVFTGAALAAALTTYEAALALPLVLAAWAAARAALPPGPRPALRSTALIAATAAAFLAPLLVFYSQHPEVVLNRLAVTQGLGGGSALEALGRAVDGYARVWWGVAGRGDALFGQNLPGRPLLDPFAAALLLAGLAGAVRGWRNPAAGLLVTAAALLALPAAVTTNAPAFTRMLPMLAALSVLAGWGAAGLWSWAEGRGARWRWGLAAVLAGGLAVGGAGSVYDYFAVWARDPRLFDARQVGVRRAAEQARALAEAGPVWLSPQTHPFVQYAFAIAFEGTAVRTWEGGPECRPYAHRRGGPTTYGVIQVLDPLSLPAYQAAYPAGREAAVILHPDGYAYAVFFQVPAGAAAPAPQHPVSAAFAGGLRLAGFDAPDRAAPGSTVTVRLHWEADGPLAGPLTGFLHLGRGRSSQPMLAQHDAPLCPGLPADRWEAGYRYIEARTLSVPAEAEPGQYDLRVGVYQPDNGARLAILAADRPAEDDRLILTDFQVP